MSTLFAITHLSSTHPSITIEKLTECGRQLAAANVPLPEGILAGILINKLPPDMANLQQTLLKPGIPKMEEIAASMKVFFESRQSKQITNNTNNRNNSNNTNSNNFPNEKVMTVTECIAAFETYW